MGPEIPEGPSPPNPDPGYSAPLLHPGIGRALEYMGARCTRRLSLAEVASVAHMSPFHFSRLFHQMVGVTFREHRLRLRLGLADEMMKRDPWAPLIRVAAQTGFGTLRNLEDHYRRVHGYSPSKGRAIVRRGAGLWRGEHDSSIGAASS
jgi:transcriptional regulator GlxA family with amidase domain